MLGSLMVCDIEKIKGKTNIGKREVNNITNVPKRFISEKSLNLSIRVNFYQKMLELLSFSLFLALYFRIVK